VLWCSDGCCCVAMSWRCSLDLASGILVSPERGHAPFIHYQITCYTTSRRFFNATAPFGNLNFAPNSLSLSLSRPRPILVTHRSTVKPVHLQSRSARCQANLFETQSRTARLRTQTCTYRHAQRDSRSDEDIRECVLQIEGHDGLKICVEKVVVYRERSL
jgi:hypothetical protein